MLAVAKGQVRALVQRIATSVCLQHQVHLQRHFPSEVPDRNPNGGFPGWSTSTADVPPAVTG